MILHQLFVLSNVGMDLELILRLVTTGQTTMKDVQLTVLASILFSHVQTKQLIRIKFVILFVETE